MNPKYPKPSKASQSDSLQFSDYQAPREEKYGQHDLNYTAHCTHLFTKEVHFRLFFFDYLKTLNGLGFGLSYQTESPPLICRHFDTKGFGWGFRRRFVHGSGPGKGPPRSGAE